MASGSTRPRAAQMHAELVHYESSGPSFTVSAKPAPQELDRLLRAWAPTGGSHAFTSG